MSHGQRVTAIPSHPLAWGSDGSRAQNDVRLSVAICGNRRCNTATVGKVATNLYTA
jgi:hypothetical protein